MKTETIIVKIEEYINTLPKSKQSNYLLAEILEELKKDFKLEEIKKMGGNSLLKRTKLIEKLILKGNTEHPLYKKGYKSEINGETMQCFIYNGCMAFMLKDFLEFEMMNEEEQKEIPKLSTFVPSNFRYFDVVNYDIADVRMNLKVHKEEQKSKPKKEKSKYCIVKIGNKWYSAEHFINVVNGLGGNVIMYQEDGAIKPAIFESENGVALLFPAKHK